MANTAVRKKGKEEQLPSTLFDPSDISAGFEGADVDSFAIPFLSILQSGSPQCKRSEGAYIKGAEEGMIINSVTQELYDGDEGVVVVPCSYKRSFIEWMPREAGGGFVAEHAPDSEVVSSAVQGESGRLMLENGNYLADTRQHYVLLLHEDGAPEPVVLSMTSTQLKKSRQWMTMMQQKTVVLNGKPVRAPMFAYMYRLTTVPESNDKGSWFGWRIGDAAPVNDASIIDAARSFRSAIMGGIAQANMEEAAQL